LLLCLGIALLVSLWPVFLTDAQGKPDHATALLLCLAVSAGIVSGFGFQPRFWLWRVMFSQWTCFMLLFWAAARLAGVLR
jgi:predicted membrane protein